MIGKKIDENTWYSWQWDSVIIWVETVDSVDYWDGQWRARVVLSTAVVAHN